MTEPREEVFLKDVEKHEMSVLLDSGVYRHLRFKAPGTSVAWFDVVTWPGFLAYSGDMGTFVFSRLDDMFKFFRTDQDAAGKLRINRSYWGEKLEAVDRGGRASGHRQYSEDRLREHVEEQVTAWVEAFEGPYDASEEENAKAKKAFEGALREGIDEEVYRYLDDGEHEARKAVRDFSHKIDDQTFEFHDSWEWDCDDYTYRFTWCCYAIAWAIRSYDAKVNEVAA
jgi:hypothetical protein